MRIFGYFMLASGFAMLIATTAVLFHISFATALLCVGGNIIAAGVIQAGAALIAKD